MMMNNKSEFWVINFFIDRVIRLERKIAYNARVLLQVGYFITVCPALQFGFFIIKTETTRNQISGGKLAMIAGPHPPAL